MDRFEFTLDGTTVSARKGQTILEVAQENGLGERIPTLCHEPGLPPYTSCYLCVVETEGMDRLLPACSAIPWPGQVVSTSSPRVMSSRKTALELLLSNHPADCVGPCQKGCPAGVDIQRYVADVAVGNYDDAVRTIRAHNPLPIVCGRVCVRKCEDACRRQLLDDAVGINMSKRVASDWWVDHPYTETPEADTGKSIAIVGGGPAGLTAAYHLRMQGHAVTIYELRDKLGGMLRWGIPDYRLPQDLLDWEIDQIVELGIDMHTGVRVGVEVDPQQLRKDHDAIYLAVGAQTGSSARMQGEDHPAVFTGVDFLRQVKEGVDHGMEGKKVAIIGGGNTAIDAARTALRLGASEVSLLYRRTRKEMPADPAEIVDADDEGVLLEFLVSPVRVETDESGAFKGIVVRRMKLGEPDASGRRRPVPVEGSDFLYECDFAVGAIGQKVDLTGLLLDDELALTRWKSIDADEYSGATSIPGVFAGGDAVTGPAVVVDAIAHGYRSALSIHHYLTMGQPKRWSPPFSMALDDFQEVRAADLPEAVARKRAHQSHLPVEERITHFEEVEFSLEEHEVQAEAARCLRCGCSAFDTCDLRLLAERYGLPQSIAGQAVRQKLDTSHPRLVLDPNKCILCTRCVRTCGDVIGVAALGLVNRGFDTVISPSLGEPLVDSACIGCGNCVEACPTGALEFKGLADTYPAERQVDTACTLCGQVCEISFGENAFGASVKAPVRDDGVRQLLCGLGRWGVPELLEGDRITRPLVRDDSGQLVAATWDEAIARVVQALKGHAADEVLLAGGADLTAEEASWLAWLGAQGLGRTGSLSVLASEAEVHALDGLMGRTASAVSWRELEKAGTVLVVGDDPMERSPVAAAHLRRAVRNGATVVALTSAPTTVTELAHHSLEVRRGSTSVLMGWLLARALEQRPTDGAGALQAALQGISAEQLRKECGVSEEDATRVLQALTAGPVVALYALDARAERSPGGLETLAQLVELLGEGQTGSGLLLTSDLPNLEGLRLSGLVPADTAVHAELATAVKGGTLKAAWIVREDPDESRDLAKGLSKLDFLVVSDLYMTATAARAQVVLPASTHLETGGTVITTDRRVLRLPPVYKARAERNLTEVLRQVATGLGYDLASFALSQGLREALDAGTLPRPKVMRWAVTEPRTELAKAVHGEVRSAARMVEQRVETR